MNSRNADIMRDIIAIVVATLLCLAFVAIAADDARVARSFADWRDREVQR